MTLDGLKKLPTEAAPPQSLQKEARSLGALDADAVEVEKNTAQAR